MLNIEDRESDNIVTIEGILSSLDIEERTTADGRDFVSAKATVRVDQEVNGQMVENDIPVKMFSMRLKSDGNPNAIYNNIINYKESFTSLAACPENQPELASKVRITGKIEENIWVSKDKKPMSTFSITSNFLNTPRGEFEQQARFEVSGVVMNKVREVDGNGEETGRLKVKMALVRYGGRVDVIDFIVAAENAVNFVEANWEDGDTVSAKGAVNFNQTTKVWYEEQGFGDPIKRTKTESKRELIILAGSPSGYEEESAYDSNSIKAGLDDRQARTAEMINKASKPKLKPIASPKNNDFGF